MTLGASIKDLYGNTKMGDSDLIICLCFSFAGYFILFEWLWVGRAPGKRLLKLGVLREDGRPNPVRGAVARNLLSG